MEAGHVRVLRGLHRVLVCALLRPVPGGASNEGYAKVREDFSVITNLRVDLRLKL